MEQSNISLDKGIHRTPSLGPDGELSECVNLIPQNGELVNIQAPKETGFTFPNNYVKPVLQDIAKFNGTELIIFTAENDTSSSDEIHGGAYAKNTATGTIITIKKSEGITSVKAFKNIVVIQAGSSCFYMRYDNGNFTNLGNTVPRLFINFGLLGELINANTLSEIDSGNSFNILDNIVRADTLEGLKMFDFGIGLNGSSIALYDENGNITNEILLDDEVEGIEFIAAPSMFNRKTFTNVKGQISTNVMSRMNSFMNKCRQSGYFYAPFLVTYTLKLYDGTEVAAAPIVMMIPDTETMPKCGIRRVETITNNDNTYIRGAYASIYGVVSKLDMCVINPGVLNNWRDIVTHVNIYISPALSKLIADEDLDTVRNNTADGIGHTPGYGYYKLQNVLDDEATSTELYVRHTFGDECETINPADTQDLQPLVNTPIFFKLPQMTESDYIQHVKDCGELYLAKSYRLDEILEMSSSNRVLIDIQNLDSLRAKASYFESYNSLSNIFPGNKFFEYNNRLHIYDYKISANDGYPASVVFHHVVDPTLLSDNRKYLRAAITRRYEGEQITSIYRTYEGNVLMNTIGQFYAYLPDEYAFKITALHRTEVQQQWEGKEFELERHNTLIGSVYFRGFSNAGHEEEGYGTIEYPSSGGSLLIPVKNRILITEESNPFVYSRSKAVTLPSDIIRLSSPAKALSQGQFGQFPLYAFCADGIWALSVSDTGTYSAKQPVSRDVVTNPDSVTQIDNAVVFVTNQGLKLISGSDVVLLSGPVEGYNLDETVMSDDRTAPLSSLPMYKFIEKCIASGVSYNEFELTSAPDTDQFVQQVQNAKIVYDYAHNLLHVFHDFNPLHALSNDLMNRHYVYSFDTQEWSSQLLPDILTTAVAGYPLSTMQFGNKLYQYEKEVGTETVTVNGTSVTRPILRAGYALTRPLALGNPLARKALYDLRVVGQRTDSRTMRRVAVYVSNDNIHWTRLASLKALSAKYYRFLIMSSMTDLDTLSGLALQHDLRYDHKLRGH